MDLDLEKFGQIYNSYYSLTRGFFSKVPFGFVPIELESTQPARILNLGSEKEVKKDFEELNASENGRARDRRTSQEQVCGGHV